MICKYCINKLFIEHPHSVGMTYPQHCCFSFSIANYFLLASVQAYIHAIIPCMFQTSSSDCVNDINGIINSRKE